MSHFPVLVIVKKDEVEVNVLSELERIEFGGKEQYVNQYKSDKVEELLAPYTEQPNSEEDVEDFFELELEENEWVTKLIHAYGRGKILEVETMFSEKREERVKWQMDSKIMDSDTKSFRNPNEEEINRDLEDFDSLVELFVNRKWDIENSEHFNLLSEFSYTDSFMWEDGKFYDRYFQNPIAKWDWYVFGGRWHSVGENGYISDLNQLKEFEVVPFWKTLSWMSFPKSPYGFDEEEEFIKDNIKDDTVIKSSDYDRETETRTNIVYYTKEELLAPTKRKVIQMNTYLSEDEGWLEYGQMGWFGISSLDSMDDEEREQVIKDTDTIVDNMLEKYIESGDYVGVVVDCHI